ncbi:MAG TPA: hypothetical protein VMY34_02205, partial [Acidimicrobiales bacterium]|nr:hypothetical protein [Acidimicrobiales bacterium]
TCRWVRFIPLLGDRTMKRGSTVRNAALRRTRKIALVTLIVGLAAAGLPAQAGIDPLGKGRVATPPTPFASDNVDVLGHIPFGGTVGATFQGNVMYVTGAEGLRTFDITDPASPMPLGALPLSHYENEDVSVEGNTLIIAAGYLEEIVTNILYVIDVTDPRLPKLQHVYKYGYAERAAGLAERVNTHTAECSPVDCKYVYVAGGGDIATLETATGKVVARWGGQVGGTHDLTFDVEGYAWVASHNGSAAFRMRPDMTQGDLIARTGASGVGSKTNPLNTFIHHNIERVGATNTVLITEEDYNRPRCVQAGYWETWTLDKSLSQSTPASPAALTNLDFWDTRAGSAPEGAERQAKNAPLASDDPTADTAAVCSAHWFTTSGSIAAIGWYEQGTRFLDYSDPTNIRQVGYWDTPTTMTWAAYFAPTDPRGEIVYVTDQNRGIDVIRFNRSVKPSVNPVVQSQSEANMIGEAPAGTRPHPTLGWACPIRL